MLTNRIDLNCDVGELSREIDDAILPLVNSCNVSCGAHAGDEKLISGTLSQALRHNVRLGAHPSWPDRESFGRRSLEIPLIELESSIAEQLRFLGSMVEQQGGQLHHVKPHGALYHDVQSRPEIAELLASVIRSAGQGLLVYGQANSLFERACEKQGLTFVAEAFADRRYKSATELCSRKQPGSLIENEADFRFQFQQLLEGRVTDIHGQQHEIRVQTICLHSDTPNAVEFARIANELLTA